ncbi:MAG: S8 family peptidase [Bacteroidota bacterium]
MQTIRYFLSLVFIFVLSTALAQEENNDPQGIFASNRLIVAFTDNTNQQERDVIRADYNATLVHFLPKLNVEIWGIPGFPINTGDGAILNDILDVQGHTVRKIKVNGSGLDYITQYPENDLDNCNSNIPPPYNPIPCCAANDVVTCGVDVNLVKVGIIDTGADLGSPQSFYVPYGVSSLGFDFVNNTTFPVDMNGHGTQMTSIIGGILEEQAAPNVRIVPLKALGANGTGSLANVVRAVESAICDTLNILNISLGYKTIKEDKCDQFFKQVLQKAIDENILVIVAAGNLSEYIGENSPYYPAAFELDGMLTIGASECTAGYAPFSNYGEPIDLLAPGVKILCRDTSFGNWIYANGTSHAAAIASGVAASRATEMTNFDAPTLKDELLLEMNSCIANILDADIPCHPLFGLDANASITALPFKDSTYTAFDTLCSSAFVPQNTRITYKAGDVIVLKPGFQVANGACFLASILDCDPYTPTPSNAVDVSYFEPSSASEKVSIQKAQLRPNYPNPFSEQTSIPYFIPLDAQSAYIEIVDLRAQRLKRIILSNFGDDVTDLQKEMNTGLYFINLYVDEKLVDSQKMIVL